MSRTARQSERSTRHRRGLTLVELLVVMAVAVILLGLSIPAAKKIMESFDYSAGAKGLINAALANARAIAVREGAYAGLRFQQDKNGEFYVIFIVHDPAATGLANGFRAFENRRPMKLPSNIGIVEGTVIQDTHLDDLNGHLTNAQTFSVVFSKTGQLVQFNVRVMHRNTMDRVFNTAANVNSGVGMFLEDSANEPSVVSFILYDKTVFKQVPSTTRYTGYIQSLQREFISPYTGELIMD